MSEAKHQSWCIGFLSAGKSPCDCRIPANQPRPPVIREELGEPMRGPCMDRSPLVMPEHVPLLCELRAGHTGGHEAGSTRWRGPDERAYTDAYLALQLVLASPPAPWVTYGTHANRGEGVPMPKLEFWGDDGAGLPLWEKVKDKPEISLVDEPGRLWCLDPGCHNDTHDHTVRDGYYED